MVYVILPQKPAPMLRSFLTWSISTSRRRALLVSGAGHVVGLAVLGGITFASLPQDAPPIGHTLVIQGSMDTPEEDFREIEFESTRSGEPVDIMPLAARAEAHRFVHTPPELVPIEDLLDAELLRQVRPSDMLSVDDSMHRQTAELEEIMPVEQQIEPVMPSRQHSRVMPSTPTAVASVPQQTSPSFAGNSPAVYPDLARQRGWEGVVLVRIHIDAEGRVIHAEIAKSSGYEVLDAAAITTVRHWRGSPATLSGRPVATVELLPFRFRLR